jgi:hypothetical protein
MVYRVSHRFVRLEALGTFGTNGRYNDPADPIALEVRVTPADDIDTTVELATMGTPKKPFRLATGIWAYDLTEGYYQTGKKYTVHFRYSMTPSAVKVDRYDFVWNPVPSQPREATGCIVHGVVAGVEGNPKPDIRIVVEKYKNFVTLNHREGTFEVVTDVFGNWFAEVPRGTILRFVYNEMSKTITVPDLPRVALSDAPAYQPADGNKDKYGYPLP